MLNSLRAEVLKMRHLHLVALAGGAGVAFSVIVFMVLRGALIRFSHERLPEVPWQNGVIGDTTVFAVLAFPTLVIILTALIYYPEHRNSMWKQLRVAPLSIQTVYAAKFAVIMSLIAVAVIASAVSAMVGWTVMPENVRTPLHTSDAQVGAKLISLTLKFFFCLIPVAVVQFALSARLSNVLHSVGIGIALTVASLFLSGPTTKLWFPYAYPAAVVISEFGSPAQSLSEDQQTDIEFTAPRAAFDPARGRQKVILVDQSHANRHGLGTDADQGTLRWIVQPALAAGIDVRTSSSLVAPGALADADLLVIAGVPLGAARGTFSSQEIESIAEWIRGGGSLLLLTDHAPYDRGAEGIAKTLGVQLMGEVTRDSSRADPRAPGTARIVFTRANGLLQQNDLTKGVNRVITYGGQAVSRPDSRTIVVLGDRSFAQLIAFEFGKGRVVVSGETAVFTAQKKGGSPIGVGDSSTDNSRLAINTINWLLH